MYQNLGQNGFDAGGWEPLAEGAVIHDWSKPATDWSEELKSWIAPITSGAANLIRAFNNTPPSIPYSGSAYHRGSTSMILPTQSQIFSTQNLLLYGAIGVGAYFLLKK